MDNAKLELTKKRGIYLLPNLFTTAGLFCGFYAIIAAMTGQYENAAIAIFVAMLMDGIDGRLARLTNTQSAFGAEYDSLADMVSFAMAPALVAFSWGLNLLGKFGWLAAFVYAAGGALRLARFNTQLGAEDKRYFQGLASPAAAAIVAGFIWIMAKFDVVATLDSRGAMTLVIVLAIVTIMAGLLMVSNFRYHSFKQLDLKDKIPFVALLILVLIFIVIAFAPAYVLFGLFSAYALSGPLFTFFQRESIKREKFAKSQQNQERNL